MNLMEIAPVALSNAYSYLYDCVKKEKIGCILFLIRDVFELFIKIPVILVFNGIHNLHDKASKNNREILDNDNLKILYQYSFQILSTGKWWECIRIMSRLDPTILCCSENPGELDFYKSTIEYAKMLYDHLFYETSSKKKNSMVTWRNSALGHSCLAENPESSYEEIPSILRMFKQVSDNSLVFYSAVAFSDINKKAIRGISFSDCIDDQVFISFSSVSQPETVYIHINSFILGQKTNYALFDGYEKGKAYLLNYADGKRYRDVTLSKYLERKTLNNQLDSNTYLSDRKNIYDDNIESEEINVLMKRISSERTIYPFDFLRRWLKDEMHKHEKGYLLLTGNSGFGKSVFCDTIDQLNMRGRFIPEAQNILEWDNFMLNTVIRVWHFDSDIHSRKDIYLSGIRDCLLTISPEYNSGHEYHAANSFKGPLEMLWNNLQNVHSNAFNSDSVDMATGTYFAKCINETLKEYQNSKGKAQLLLVLDGVDELPDNTELFSYLPEVDALASNVFIMIVSRTKKEIKNNSRLNRYFERISFCSQFEFTESFYSIIENGSSIDSGDSIEYKKILFDYIVSAYKLINVEFDESRSKELAEMYEYRFSSISAYLNLCLMNRQFIQERDENIFRLFWDLICKESPDNYWNDIRDVLVTLCYAGEALSLRELAYLSGQRYVSFRLLGILSDISPFIYIERTVKGNCYRLNHDQWKKAIGNLFADSIEHYLERCYALALELENTINRTNIIRLLDPSYAGELWLFEHLFYITESVLANIDSEDVERVVDHEGLYSKIFVEIAALILADKRIYKTVRQDLMNNSYNTILGLFDSLSRFSEYNHSRDLRMHIKKKGKVAKIVTHKYKRYIKLLLRERNKLSANSVVVLNNQMIRILDESTIKGSFMKSVYQQRQRDLCKNSDVTFPPEHILISDSRSYSPDRTLDIVLIRLKEIRYLEENKNGTDGMYSLSKGYYELAYAYGLNRNESQMLPNLMKGYEYAKELCEISATHKNLSLKGRLEEDIGIWTCLINKQYKEALPYFYQALSTMDESGKVPQDEKNYIKMWGKDLLEMWIGKCYMELKETPKALDHYKKAFKYASLDMNTSPEIKKDIVDQITVCCNKLNMDGEVEYYKGLL